MLKRRLVAASPSCRRSEVDVGFSRGEADKSSDFIKTEPSQAVDSAEAADLTVDEAASDDCDVARSFVDC